MYLQNNVGWLFDLILNVPVNICKSCWDGATASWVLPVLFWGVKIMWTGHFVKQHMQYTAILAVLMI